MRGETCDILFALAPQSYEGFSHSLLGYYLSAYLERVGFCCRQFIDYSPAGTLDSIALKFSRVPTLAYAFTAYDTNVLLSLSLAKRIKQIRPESKIIFGGPFCQPNSNHDRLLFDGSPIDVVVTGSGFEPIALLLKAFKSAKEISLVQIPGIAFRSGRQIVRTPRAERIPLEKQPSPYLSGTLPLKSYFRDENSFAIVSAQGCDAHCLFCNYAIINNFMVDFSPLDHTMEELRVMGAFSRKKAEGRATVFLLDDDFAIDLDRAKTLCCRIISDKLYNFLELRTHLSVHCADKELLTLMGKAGFQQANFGIESGVPEILHKMKKLHHISRDDDLSVERKYLEKARELIVHANKIGLPVTASFVSGMPFEKREDALKTLEYIKTLNIEQYSFNLFIPWSGSIYSRQNAQSLDFDNRYQLLPRRTKFPFDPTTVARLPNAATFPETELGRYFSGDYSESTKKGNYFHPKFVFISSETDSVTREDLNKILNIGDHIFCEIEHEDKIEGLEKEFLSNEVPTSIVKYVKPLRIGGSLRELYVHPEYEITSLLTGGFADVENLDLSFDLKPRRQEDTAVVFSIDSGNDLEFFLKKTIDVVLAAQTPIKVSEIMPTIAKFWLIDSCRWSATPCPAVTMGRLVVQSERTYSPCFNGPKFICDNPDQNKIRKGFEKILNEKRKDFGCEQCHAKNNCSQCVATAGLPHTAYCALVKSYDWLTHIVPLMKVLRQVIHPEEIDSVSIGLRPNQTFEFDVPTLKKWQYPYNDRGAYVIEIGLQRMLVETRMSRVFEMEPAETYAFEALRYGLDEVDIIRFMRKFYRLDRLHAQEIIRDMIVYALPWSVKR